MAAAAEVHVGDIGTTYKVLITDAGTPFDPSAATTKELFFKMPQGTVVTVPATVVAEGGDFYLQAVIVDSGPTVDFHSTAGPISIQAHVVFADGTEYRSAIETNDTDGNRLTVLPNLV